MQADLLVILPGVSIFCANSTCGSASAALKNTIPRITAFAEPGSEATGNKMIVVTQEGPTRYRIA